MRACRGCKLEVAPNVLRIHLKRYGLGRFGKVNRGVSYPERLDLAPHVAKGAMDDKPARCAGASPGWGWGGRLRGSA